MRGAEGPKRAHITHRHVDNESKLIPRIFDGLFDAKCLWLEDVTTSTVAREEGLVDLEAKVCILPMSRMQISANSGRQK